MKAFPWKKLKSECYIHKIWNSGTNGYKTTRTVAAIMRLCSFPCFLYFVLNNLSGIVGLVSQVFIIVAWLGKSDIYYDSFLL